MNLNEFIPQAIRTESRIEKVEVNKEVLELLLGSFIAFGHLLDQVKKNVFYNKPYNVENLHKTLTSDLGVMASNELDIDHTKQLLEQKETIDVDPRVFHAIVGILTESTELAEQLLKGVRGEKMDRINLLEELGDNFWYSAVMMDALQANPDNVLETVVRKLKARFPDKFTSNAAINRDLNKEREVLEGNIK